MRIIEYRDGPFVNREGDERFLLERFKGRPEKILFIYGPKSSGKTTLVEYVVENCLQNDRGVYVNYINFRGHAIVNYKDFIDIYFQPISEGQKSWLTRLKERLSLNLGLFRGSASLPIKGVSFGLNIELYNQLRRNEVDPFVVLLEILRNIKEKRQPILILDEVQALQSIYMNGEVRERHLLTEFFNFLVRLTKETHIAHIVVMTSETLFLEKIYNYAKLAETSDFYKIGHLSLDEVREWLSHEGIEDEAVIDLIWEYVGGSAHRINDAVRVVKKGDDIQKYLINEAKIYRGKLSQFISKEFDTVEEMDKFGEILADIVKKGFLIRDLKDKLETKVLTKAIDYEFLFLDPKDEKIAFNSRIIKKGAEMLAGQVG